MNERHLAYLQATIQVEELRQTVYGSDSRQPIILAALITAAEDKRPHDVVSLAEFMKVQPVTALEWAVMLAERDYVEYRELEGIAFLYPTKKCMDECGDAIDRAISIYTKFLLGSVPAKGNH